MYLLASINPNGNKAEHFYTAPNVILEVNRLGNKTLPGESFKCSNLYN